MSISVYCVRMDPVDNQVVCKNLDVLNEVLFMGVTSRPVKKGVKAQHPPGIPMFVTAEATYFQLHSVESYQRMLQPYGFDLFHSSYLVNVPLVDRIEIGRYGNDAYFKGGGNIHVPVSRPKTEEYRQLVIRGPFQPEFGL
ncbi:LytTR family transcriptional regulator DNA-binding domain-containing protein [Paenibacillus sp. OV219]|uniref:LytTR family transcriptional regulator DNA-binding domain-containing protein n=1 Tax=Paenibacillus sp. OV219 TaxID=1884377 RepID=UPI0008AB7EA7|nr:LytTR family transcriptional regulator DNA-binding domain-containing protein [Paenibacillus sp. OV219]SEN59257.1 LytTr DNA-binding domain-containing protein [Paenibacillus sp. OV219]